MRLEVVKLESSLPFEMERPRGLNSGEKKPPLTPATALHWRMRLAMERPPALGLGWSMTASRSWRESKMTRSRSMELAGDSTRIWW